MVPSREPTIALEDGTLCHGCGISTVLNDDQNYCSPDCRNEDAEVQPLFECMREASAHFKCDLMLLKIVFKILFRLRKDENMDNTMFVQHDEYVKSTSCGFECQVDHLKFQSYEWIESIRSYSTWFACL
jgi:hypothetical protein